MTYAVKQVLTSTVKCIGKKLLTFTLFLYLQAAFLQETRSVSKSLFVLEITSTAENPSQQQMLLR